MVRPMSLIEQSLSTIRAAVTRFKKKPLADRAGVSDSLLRDVADADWDPRATTLRKLEGAALSLEKEHGPETSDVHREKSRRNPSKPRGRA
jgi:predicted transcriptional regulator